MEFVEGGEGPQAAGQAVEVGVVGEVEHAQPGELLDVGREADQRAAGEVQLLEERELAEESRRQCVAEAVTRQVEAAQLREPGQARGHGLQRVVGHVEVGQAPHLAEGQGRQALDSVVRETEVREASEPGQRVHQPRRHAGQQVVREVEPLERRCEGRGADVGHEAEKVVRELERSDVGEAGLEHERRHGGQAAVRQAERGRLRFGCGELLKLGQRLLEGRQASPTQIVAYVVVGGDENQS